MRAAAPVPVLRPMANPPAACRTPAARRAAPVEVAEARVRAAALHGDPLAVEAAGRAYVVAASRAHLADFARAMGAILGQAWRSISTSAQTPRA